MSLVDSHCHLDDSQFDEDREAAIERALAAGIDQMLAIGTGEGPPDLEAAIRLADRYEAIYASAGIHPQYAPKTSSEHIQTLTQILRHPKCVAVGEIGLDYYWEPFDADLQARVFIDQMNVAAEAQKPIIIHTREAWSDTMRLLREHWVPTGLPCVMHCFTGGPNEATEAIELGFYLSFAGVLTYPKASNVREAAALVPADRLLVETDSPYLAPVPHRGKRNEPAHVVHTASKLAEIRREYPADLARSISLNFERFRRSGELSLEANRLH
jgi:TatD DNase family protein